MSQDARALRRAGKVVLRLYQDYEPRVTAKIAEKYQVTCSRGCNHCCHLPASASLPEMAPIVESLAGRTDWNTRRREMERAVRAQLPIMAEVAFWQVEKRQAFFERRMPCVFLRGGECSVYDQRPAVCRYHYAVTPPENCAHGAADPRVATVNLEKVVTSVQLAGAQELGVVLMAPIPVTLVWAARKLGVKFDVPSSPALDPQRWAAFSLAMSQNPGPQGHHP